jgi:two-component system cell cycle response regulator
MGLPEDAAGRILVIEDRQVAAQQIAQTLGGQNTVETELNPDEALIRVRGDDNDLIIVSLDLKGTDGLRLCSQLRAIDVTRQTPILAVSDDSDMKRLLRALELGVNDFVSRPVDQLELNARVKTLLRRKKYQDKLKENIQLSFEMAITDQLTGLYNRRYMQTHLDGLLARAQRQSKSLSILMMDMDHFKQVNDTHGHAVGDEVLIEFSRRLQRNVRGLDLACRHGGEEFVVVMPETDPDFARVVAERLREDVAAKPFETDAGPLDITISIGIASSSPATEKAEDLLKQADEALYRAKDEGRNRVEAWAETKAA